MPQLEVGNMDSIKTKAEAMPAQKKVLVQIVAPQNAEDKAKEVYKSDDGKLGMVRFTVKVLEGPNTGRYTKISAFTHVDNALYLTWKLKKEGRDMTQAEKQEAWDKRDYLKDLKRIGEAIGVNFGAPDNQPTEDAYGKELRVDIVQKENEGEIYNEARNPKKA